jgi:hypothetical protein
LGYELSARAADEKPSGTTVLPSAFLTPGGGGAVLAGRF